MDAEHTERARERLRAAEAEAVNRAKANGKADDEPQVDPLTPAPQLSAGAPLATARELIRRRYTAGGLRTIHHRGGVFYCWTGTHYPVADDATIRAKVYNFLDGATKWDEDKKTDVPFQPTRNKVHDVIDALKAAANLDSATTAPAWLDDTADIPPSEIIACTNGLLHLPTRALVKHSPAFFTYNALDFAYDPDALDPVEWLRFLDTLWPEDRASIETLQEMFGYLLTGDTRQQKVFLLVGPKRSGKGTIARIMTALLGRDNICGPTGQNFGLAPLIGKQAAIIADARLGARADQVAVAERLLSISGEDSITIDRKFLAAWTGRLSARFVILTNELPRLTDASGALASRFIVLTLAQSFYGREDHTLAARLLSELPGILNWSIEGWERLQARGRFQQPESAIEAVQELEDIASPIGAFLRQRCHVAPGLSVACDTLFGAWKLWCANQGRDHAGTVQTFGRDLRAAIPRIRVVQRRKAKGVVRFYEGVTLA
jgi:putative DNA primase/helicase